MKQSRINYRFRFIYSEIEFAVMCNESIETLIKLREKDKLPSVIQYREYDGIYLYSISKTTHSLIGGLISLGVTKVFQLLTDAQQNGFIVTLQLNYRTLDLSSYK